MVRSRPELAVHASQIARNLSRGSPQTRSADTLWIAALAFFAWMLLEPGFLRSLCYDMLVIGSVTTVLFNANPLLRYDGYYILCDLIEVPNLGNRANAYWFYLLRRYAFGIVTARPPSATAAERRWFIVYAPAAFVYRLSVTFAIAWFIGQQYFFIGVLLALWSVGSALVWCGCERTRRPARARRVSGAWCSACRWPARCCCLPCRWRITPAPMRCCRCRTGRCCAPVPTASCVRWLQPPAARSRRAS